MGAIKNFAMGLLASAAASWSPASAADRTGIDCIAQPSAACIDALMDGIERDLGAKARFLAQVEQRDIGGARATLARAPADEQMKWLRDGTALLLPFGIADHTLERRSNDPVAVTAASRLACERFEEAVPAETIPQLIADPDRRLAVYRSRLNEVRRPGDESEVRAQTMLLKWLHSDDPVATQLDIELPGLRGGELAVARAQARWVNGDRAGAQADLDRYLWPHLRRWWTASHAARPQPDEMAHLRPDSAREADISTIIFSYRRKSEWVNGILTGIGAVGITEEQLLQLHAMAVLRARAWHAFEHDGLDAALTAVSRIESLGCEWCLAESISIWRDVARVGVRQQSQQFIDVAVAQTARIVAKDPLGEGIYTATASVWDLLAAGMQVEARKLGHHVGTALLGRHGEHRDLLLARLARTFARGKDNAAALELLRHDPMLLVADSDVLAYLSDSELDSLRGFVGSATWFEQNPGIQISLATRLARAGRTEELAVALDRLDLSNQRAVAGMVVIALRDPAWPIRPVDVRSLGDRLPASKSNDTVAGWIATALSKQRRHGEALQWALARPRPESRLHALAAISASLREPTECPNAPR